MDTTPKIVLQNPYRILGVYANAAKKDIVANKGKATAFLNVNKPVEYPLDLKGILPAPNRTLDLMNEAEAHLAIAKEQIKYAQFWFLQKMSPLDDIAFNHLLAGNMAGAIGIWSKQETLSSLQNKLVCYLIDSKLELAIKTAEKLYNRYGNDYISKVDANCTLQMTTTDLLHQFVDSLGEEIGMQKLLSFDLEAETKAYISGQAIGPLINKISSEVDKTKKVDHKDPKARIEAARKLVANTKEAFSQLKSILPATDSQYQMIADKLGLEILQCGIDHFLGLKDEDDDAPYTAMKMLKHARTIVVGSLAIGRCDDQIKELQKYIENLPPKEVMTEDRVIKAELAKYVRLPDKISHAVNLLNNTKPHLQSIKLKLGATNAYYLKLSTQIVGNALHNIVEEVNAVQNNPQIATRLQFGQGLDSESFYRIKGVLRNAWKSISVMDSFDMETKFKKEYERNRLVLKSLCEDFGVLHSNAYRKKLAITIIAGVLCGLVWGFYSQNIFLFFVGFGMVSGYTWYSLDIPGSRPIIRMEKAHREMTEFGCLMKLGLVGGLVLGAALGIHHQSWIMFAAGFTVIPLLMWTYLKFVKDEE